MATLGVLLLVWLGLSLLLGGPLLGLYAALCYWRDRGTGVGHGPQ